MPDRENMTLALLREMHRRMEGRFDRVDQKLITHDARFEALEKKIDDVKKAAFGESLVGRYMAVEERPAAIEARLAALENRS